MRNETGYEAVKFSEHSMIPICRRIYLEFTLRSQKWGLPPNVCITLIHLYLQPEIFEPAALAENALFPRQTMTFILDVIEKKNLAVRMRHPSDRRRKTIQLTPKGRQLTAAMLKDFVQFEEKALQSVTPRTLNTHKAFLNRYADALAGQNAGDRP